MRAMLDLFALTPPFHGHETGDDHFHDADDYALDYDPELDGLYQSDHVTLTTAGIDICSSGSQVVFSRIQMQRLGDLLSSRYFVVARQTLYRSEVALTPYAGALIDAEALRAIINDAYRAAGIAPADIDTGAVILTGEALRRENAQVIAELLAAQGGDFVCTMAGHHLEASLAAYGSGAAFESNRLGKTILNIDIGGGTTKFAIVEKGRVVQTAALHVGGRLHVFDSDGKLTRLEPAGQGLAAAAGLSWAKDGATTDEERARLAELMASRILEAVTEPEAVENLFLTAPLQNIAGVEAVMFSGGVSEYVYERESRDFGDMGKGLGAALARRIAAGALPWPLLPAGAGIRATALGLSEYAVQLSGNTIYLTDPDAVLPRRNLRVARPACDLDETIEPAKVAAAIADAIRIHELGDECAFAFSWRGTPSYARIRAFAEGVALGLATHVHGPAPIVLVLDGDIARTLGRILAEELSVTAPLLILDGVVLSDFDHIDLGRVRRPSNTVPITIKSLLFSKDPRGIAQ